MIITLCGSTRFKAEFFGWAKRLTYEGHIVLMPFIYGHCGDQVNDSIKDMLDKLHRDKILLSERIDIICPDNYIGESTKKEIEIAKDHAIFVVYHHHPYCFADGEPEDAARCLFCSVRKDCYNTEMMKEHGDAARGY